MNAAPAQAPTAKSRFVSALTIAAVFVALLWAIEIVDTVLSGRLDFLGIRPRSLEGLWGVLFAPLLHSGFPHLIANTLPAFLLSFIILLSGTGVWIRATAVIWVIAGIGTWLTGAPNSVHIGASSLIFGWIVYLLIRGFFTKSALQILTGVIIFLLYGSVLLGVLPTTPGVSWQGHLFGAIGGVVAAVGAGKMTQRPKPIEYSR